MFISGSCNENRDSPAYMPVCGSNMKTYEGPKRLANAVCESRGQIFRHPDADFVQAMGQCRGKYFFVLASKI